MKEGLRNMTGWNSSKEQSIINEVKEYLDYLETPNENFNGMAVCPFLKKERLEHKLMIKVWYPDKTPFLDVIDEFQKSDFNSALLICMDGEGVKWKDVKRKRFQRLTQMLLKKSKHKNLKTLCFSPFEKITAAGEETRKRAPYFLINIADKNELGNAHTKLLKTKYYDNFTEKELKGLKITSK